MKVSILHPFTPQAAGVIEKGISNYHSQPHVLAMENLVSQGFDCTMEYFTSRFFKYQLEAGNVKWNFYPVTYSLRGNYKKWKKQSSGSCLRAYRKTTPDVTIINMSAHSSQFSYELSKIILNSKKAYIAMLGGQHYSDTKRNRAYYKDAHHILVHTKSQKSELRKLELFKNKDIRVFPLGVDCTIFKPGVDMANNTDPKLLYVGRIIEWKRIHLAIQALKKLKDAGFENPKLNIIGPVSSENYFRELKNMVVELELKKNVFFLGHKNHSELPSYFQEADLFTLPSDKETFGMVMIEAMACGTPVAGIDCPGGPADVITHHVNGILTSPENYSKEILMYFKNKDRQKTISEQARIKVLKEYSIKATSDVLKSSVESALNKS